MPLFQACPDQKLILSRSKTVQIRVLHCTPARHYPRGQCVFCHVGLVLFYIVCSWLPVKLNVFHPSKPTLVSEPIAVPCLVLSTLLVTSRLSEATLPRQPGHRWHSELQPVTLLTWPRPPGSSGYSSLSPCPVLRTWTHTLGSKKWTDRTRICNLLDILGRYLEWPLQCTEWPLTERLSLT